MSIGLCVAAFPLAALVLASVELVGTLRNGDGEPLAGTITVVREGSNLVFSNYLVREDGRFRIASEGAHELVVMAVAPDHPSSEKIVPEGSTGRLSLDFVLPWGQDAEGRVVDRHGNGVPGAAVRVRYHEPDKPMRRIEFNAEEVADGAGRFLLHAVAVDIPFVVDAYAEGYLATSSQRFKLTRGYDKPLAEIVLKESGATVIVSVVDKEGKPASGAEVTLVADPAGLSEEARGSRLHTKSFLQRADASALGTARFTGVPPGRIIVHAKSGAGPVEQRMVVSVGREERVTLRLP